jgi:hypothetical protein
MLVWNAYKSKQMTYNVQSRLRYYKTWNVACISHSAFYSASRAVIIGTLCSNTITNRYTSNGYVDFTGTVVLESRNRQNCTHDSIATLVQKESSIVNWYLEILHKFQEKNLNLNRDSNSDLQISSLASEQRRKL